MTDLSPAAERLTNYRMRLNSELSGVSTDDLDQVLAELADVRARLDAAERARDGFEVAIRAVVSGDMPRKVASVWADDQRPSKHDRCEHNMFMYETCGSCIDEFLTGALPAPPLSAAKP